MWCGSDGVTYSDTLIWELRRSDILLWLGQALHLRADTRFKTEVPGINIRALNLYPSTATQCKIHSLICLNTLVSQTFQNEHKKDNAQSD